MVNGKLQAFLAITFCTCNPSIIYIFKLSLGFFWVQQRLSTGSTHFEYSAQPTAPQFSLQNCLKNCYSGISLILLVSPFGFTDLVLHPSLTVTITFCPPTGNRIIENTTLQMLYHLIVIASSPQRYLCSISKQDNSGYLNCCKSHNLKCPEVKAVSFYHTSSPLGILPQSKTPHASNALQWILTCEFFVHSGSLVGCLEYLSVRLVSDGWNSETGSFLSAYVNQLNHVPPIQASCPFPVVWYPHADL